ncbi:hypothetical protein M378DRAFT_163139 [Amanita muscaria Koide BX008]|uniref:Uncharacterized protein n=1 Tax=Amanita muscaria (strain Koide BX008) TaxID=946122 RepID=A0A0C2WRV0_AMAMK|nr:hypothetical protein M378DRAFT_163139 [Amanita muscaria Koide BX008]
MPDGGDPGFNFSGLLLPKSPASGVQGSIEKFFRWLPAPFRSRSPDTRLKNETLRS